MLKYKKVVVAVQPDIFNLAHPHRHDDDEHMTDRSTNKNESFETYDAMYKTEQNNDVWITYVVAGDIRSCFFHRQILLAAHQTIRNFNCVHLHLEKSSV